MAMVYRVLASSANSPAASAHSPAEAVGRAIADANNQLWTAMPESLQDEFRRFGAVAIKAYLDTVSLDGVTRIISENTYQAAWGECERAAAAVVGSMRVL